ncbi:hypothetical protein AwErysi_00790 [Erysipelotrichaceae bacterium]|nr:hypothetical protein AwErysi_00790 [Erysipelotrichaceae bacterium]
MFEFILFLAIAYIYGSINNGIIISKYIHGKDVRGFGSHGAGSTNILRTFGKKTALAVFILDVSKPIVPMLLAMLFVPLGFFIPSAKAWICLAAVIGQCYPLFFHFKGGKGAAATLGTMLSLFPLVALGAAVIFFLIIKIKKIVSLATILAISFSTIGVYFLSPQYLLPYSFIVVLILWSHRENIKRLIQGTERKLGDPA